LGRSKYPESSHLHRFRIYDRQIPFGADSLEKHPLKAVWLTPTAFSTFTFEGNLLPEFRQEVSPGVDYEYH